MISEHIKRFFGVCIFLSWCTHFYAQSSLKEIEFQTVAKKVVQYYFEKDSSQLNNYISKTKGLFIVYRCGQNNCITHIKTLSFNSNPSLRTIINMRIKSDIGKKDLNVEYSNLPIYTCSTEEWNKEGLFVDTTKIDHLLLR